MIARSSMTVPTSDESVRSSGASAVTVVVSSTPPDLQRDVHARALVDLEDHAAADPFLEPRHVDFDDVGAGCQERRGVAPGVVGHVRVRRAFAHLADGDGGARHDAVGVADRADNRARGDLRVDGRRLRPAPSASSPPSRGAAAEMRRVVMGRFSLRLRAELTQPERAARSLSPAAAEVKMHRSRVQRSRLSDGSGVSGDDGGNGDQVPPPSTRRNGETENS